jgi:N-acetylmuramoyl-L-alanine amidase
MPYTITQNFIPGLPQTPYRNGVGCYEGVTAHSTDTPNATAANERNFEGNTWSTAYVHFFVDWTSIVQVCDTNYQSWHAGPVGNARFIGVELCETSDPNLFAQSYARYTWLLAKILFDKKLGVTRKGTFWTHADVSNVLGGSNHQDPVLYLQSHGVSVDQLVNDVASQYNAMANPAPAPSTGDGRIGTVTVLCNTLNVRTGPGTSFPTAPRGPIHPSDGAFAVFAVQNGWYNLGGNQWCSGDPSLVKFTPKGDGRIGNLTVICSTLNVRTGPSTDYPMAARGPIHPSDGAFAVYATQNGWYNLGGNQWCSGNPQYVKFTQV